MQGSELKRSTDNLSSQTASDLVDRYIRTRQQSKILCQPLEIEDYGLQSMAEASPPKWHLAHVTWFFETFILKVYQPNHKPFNAQFEVLFNSYYNAVGEQFPRPQRGLLSRPTVAEVYEYRKQIDEQMLELLTGPLGQNQAVIDLTLLGINHEQQHQELLLTDLKHHLFQNPLYPIYLPEPPPTPSLIETSQDLHFHEYAGGVSSIGVDGGSSSELFQFDNEGPRHDVMLYDFSLANRLVTNEEFLYFIEDQGYSSPLLWLSDGWATIQQKQWQAPLYWVQQDGKWYEFTLHGLQPLNLQKPVSHVSFYEAMAFAEWNGKRLPTEDEWESVAQEIPISGNFQDDGYYEPIPDGDHLTCDYPSQLFGNLWEWTQSAYQPYPGFRAAPGAIGEYNGKFMCNQLVLKGGSCATPRNHIRTSYRNFFYPGDRWQFKGIRLADSL